ncbi:MAG: transcription antitermination factor NusB [Lachnospiraceae bacterium]|nr:transcription antitermination factor NusB [Lachnospiraceae bacterium]
MTRRKIREHIFRILFDIGFHSENEFEEQYEMYWNVQEDSPNEEEHGEIKEKLKAIRHKISEMDPVIEKCSKGWKLNRIGNADITILRLAIYEIKYDEKVPVKVAINEAVELAKKYGMDNSPGFVNGILANVAKQYEEGLE